MDRIVRRSSRGQRSLAPVSVGAIAVLMAAALLWAAWTTIQRGRAESFADEVEIAQQEWIATQRKTGALPDITALRAATAALELARRLDEINPRYAELLGQIYAAVAISGDVVKGFDARSLDYFAEAVVRRPSSPYAWANLAWAKYQAGQIDRVLMTALAQAARLGPWEKEVQFVVVDLGFALWAEIPPTLQTSVTTTAKNAQRHWPNEVATIAEKRGRLAEVCGFEQTAATTLCKMLADAGRA